MANVAKYFLTVIQTEIKEPMGNANIYATLMNDGILSETELKKQARRRSNQQ